MERRPVSVLPPRATASLVFLLVHARPPAPRDAAETNSQGVIMLILFFPESTSLPFFTAPRHGNPRSRVPRVVLIAPCPRRVSSTGYFVHIHRTNCFARASNMQKIWILTPEKIFLNKIVQILFGKIVPKETFKKILIPKN